MVGFSRLVATIDPKNPRACGEIRATSAIRPKSAIRAIDAVQAEWPAVAGASLWTRVLVLVSRYEIINPSVVAEGCKPFKRERRRRVAGERFELMIEVGLVGVVTEKGSAGPGEKLGGIPRLEKCGNRAAETQDTSENLGCKTGYIPETAAKMPLGDSEFVRHVLNGDPSPCAADYLYGVYHVSDLRRRGATGEELPQK